MEDALTDDMDAEVAGFDDPAWIGPTATWNASSTHRHGQRSSRRSWSTSGRIGSCPAKTTRCRSCASRSSQPAAGTRSTIDGPLLFHGDRLQPGCTSRSTSKCARGLRQRSHAAREAPASASARDPAAIRRCAQEAPRAARRRMTTQAARRSRGEPEQQSKRQAAEHGDVAPLAALCAVAPSGLAHRRLQQRMCEAEESERKQERGRARGPRPSGLETARDDEHLAEEQRRRRQAGQRSERDAHHASKRRIRSRNAGHGTLGRTRLVRDERGRGIEARRLRHGMRCDVNGDARQGKRCPEPDAERDHSHVLEARIGEQPFPGERAPKKGNRDGKRQEAEEDQDVLRCPHADHGRERMLGAPRDEQHGGQQRCREERRHRRRRLECASRQPVVHWRPADLRRQACQEENVRDERRAAAGRIRREGVPGECAGPAAGDACDEDDDPEQRDAEAERREDEVLPCCLERLCLAAEADEQRRGGGRRLDEQPSPAEVAGQRHRQENGPERVEHTEVRLGAPATGTERAVAAGEIPRRGENGGEAHGGDHADEQPTGRIDDDPRPVTDRSANAARAASTRAGLSSRTRRRRSVSATRRGTSSTRTATTAMPPHRPCKLLATSH